MTGPTVRGLPCVVVGSPSTRCSGSTGSSSSARRSSDEEEGDRLLDNVAPTTTIGGSQRYDIFLSHLQRNAQDAIIAMQMFLKEARPGIRIFVDVDVDMRDGLQETIRRGVQTCGAFLFFITDGILGSPWCLQELRWAVQYGKNIVIVRETDARHGGIDMKDFFKQVPADLLPVFQNGVAIPWYREKGFRGVSVQTILTRANLQDAFQTKVHKLHKTKRDLEAIFKPQAQQITCFDIIQERSKTLWVVLFMGGFASFKDQANQRVYNTLFSSSFLFCAVLCTLTVVGSQRPTRQTVLMNFLTAYIHIPAWQSWAVWRRYVHSQACGELLAKVHSCEERQEKLSTALHLGGRLALLLQLTMVSLALVGIALPAVLHAVTASDGNLFFHCVHAVTMSLVIPPMVAAMIASYVMFGLTSALHLLDIFAMKDLFARCVGPLAGFYDDMDGSDTPMSMSVATAGVGDAAGDVEEDSQDIQDACSEAGTEVDAGAGAKCEADAGAGANYGPGRGADAESPPSTPRMKQTLSLSNPAQRFRFNTVEALEEISWSEPESLMETGKSVQDWQHHAALEEHLLRMVADLSGTLIDGVQGRIDRTCEAVGALWIHLVIFSLCQVLAVSVSGAVYHVGDQYPWRWTFQRIFHMGGGTLLLAAALGVFGVVTARLRRVPRYVTTLLRQAGCPVSRHSSVMSWLGVRPLGMHVLCGYVYVDAPKAVAVVTLLCMAIVREMMLAIPVMLGASSS